MSDPTPLDFLKAVYCNEGLPLHVRMKAAIEAAPYVHPKLSATAVLTSDGRYGQVVTLPFPPPSYWPVEPSNAWPLRYAVFLY
jgi:hypothetical protein